MNATLDRLNQRARDIGLHATVERTPSLLVGRYVVWHDGNGYSCQDASDVRRVLNDLAKRELEDIP